MKRKLLNALALALISLSLIGCSKTTQSVDQENSAVGSVSQAIGTEATIDANDSLTDDIASEKVTNIDETAVSEATQTDSTEVASTPVSSESSDKTSTKNDSVAKSDSEAPATEVTETTEKVQESTEQSSESTKASDATASTEAVATSEEQSNATVAAAPKTTSTQRTSSPEDLFLDNGSGIYNYAASVISSGNTDHVFYCSNRNDYVVTDYICYRSCEIQSDGTYVYSDKKTVLKPTSGAWDSVHVCDPSVIQGSFSYNGSNYSYLMAYLGCNTTNSQENKIGLAVSNSLGGGWTKIAANPIISIPYDYNHSDAFQWGVGQPSIISVDGAGTVLICYTSGTWNLTSQNASLWNLSDLNNPTCLGTVTVSNSGTNDFISNADFAYSGGTLYLICDKHPFSPGTLSNVSDVSCVYSTNINIADINAFASCTWQPVATIGVYSKNHNAAFFRDVFGNLASRNVLYTKADQLGTFSDSLWTYRLKKAGF